MKCMIKRVKKIYNPEEKKTTIQSIYFNKNISVGVNHWDCRDEAKIFDSVAEAKRTIKLYKLKNIEIEKIYNIKK